MTTREQARRIRAEVSARPLEDLLEAYDQIRDDQNPTSDENAYIDGIVIDAAKKAIVDATPTDPSELAAHIRDLAEQHSNGAASRESWKLRVLTVTNIALKRYPGEKAMADWESNPRYNNPLEALADAIDPTPRT